MASAPSVCPNTHRNLAIPVLRVDDLTLQEPALEEGPLMMATAPAPLSISAPARVGLDDVVSNALVLHNLSPFLCLKSLLSLAATNKCLRQLLLSSPSPFRHLDLNPIKSAFELPKKPANSNISDEDYYATPLKTVFNHLTKSPATLTRCTSTLVLDTLPVPISILQIIIDPSASSQGHTPFPSLRVLSVRESKHLNQTQLTSLLKFALRPTRPANTPTIHSLYVFGQHDNHGPPEPAAPPSTHVHHHHHHHHPLALLATGRRRSPTRYAETPRAHTIRAIAARLKCAEWQRRTEEVIAASAPPAHELGLVVDKWYAGGAGRKVLARTPPQQWADVLAAARGVMHFDAVLCRGPRHDVALLDGRFPGLTLRSYVPPRVATVALGSGCARCGSAPEGWVGFEDGSKTWDDIPLVAPVCAGSSSLKEGLRPPKGAGRLLARCTECLGGRWCESCLKWWCEECYVLPAGDESGEEGEEQIPDVRMGSRRDCFGCGETCADCKELYIRACRLCQNEYCIVDNDGSSPERCDWCNHSGRRTRELY